VLSRCHLSLRHLSLKLFTGDEGLLPLQFPALESLGLEQTSWIFPTWMLVPPSLKLESHFIHEGLPSISELSIIEIQPYMSALDHVCPELQVLDFQFAEHTDGRDLGRLLGTRRDNATAGLEVGGIEMQSLKKLVIPFDELDELTLDKYRELVDESLDSNEQPWFWEIEV